MSVGVVLKVSVAPGAPVLVFRVELGLKFCFTFLVQVGS